MHEDFVLADRIRRRCPSAPSVCNCASGPFRGCSLAEEATEDGFGIGPVCVGQFWPWPIQSQSPPNYITGSESEDCIETQLTTKVTQAQSEVRLGERSLTLRRQGQPRNTSPRDLSSTLTLSEPKSLAHAA